MIGSQATSSSHRLACSATIRQIYLFSQSSTSLTYLADLGPKLARAFSENPNQETFHEISSAYQPSDILEETAKYWAVDRLPSPGAHMV